MGSFQSNVLLYFLRCTGILFLLSQYQISYKKYLSYKDFTFFPNILSTSLTVYLPDVLTTGRIKQYVSPKISKGQQFCPFWHSQSGLPLEEHEWFLKHEKWVHFGKFLRIFTLPESSLSAHTLSFFFSVLFFSLFQKSSPNSLLWKSSNTEKFKEFYSEYSHSRRPDKFCCICFIAYPPSSILPSTPLSPSIPLSTHPPTHP